MRHLCHVPGCKNAVPPKFLCCRKHWAMVPPELRRAVWSAYKPGQEIRKDPSPTWVAAADAAIKAVADKEAQQCAR